MIEKIKNRETFRYFRRRFFPRQERYGIFIHQIALVVTSRCQARCIMCHSWQAKPAREFSLKDLKLFLSSSKLPYLKDISLTGGDPYLREDLVEIARLIKEYHPKIKFYAPANGLNPEQIVEKATAINRFSPLGVCISMDGIGEVQDLIRGQPGTFEKTMETVIRMHRQDNSLLLWSFTIIPQNVEQIYKVYELSKRYTESIKICFRPAGSGFYFNTEDNQKFKLKGKDLTLAIQQLEEINKEYKNYWLDYVIYFLKTSKKLIPCGAGRYSCVIMPDFDVYPCTHCPESWCLGNLRDYGYSINRLLSSSIAQEILNTRVKGCNNCVNEMESLSTIAARCKGFFSSIMADLKLLVGKLKWKSPVS